MITFFFPEGKKQKQKLILLGYIFVPGYQQNNLEKKSDINISQSGLYSLIHSHETCFMKGKS